MKIDPTPCLGHGCYDPDMGCTIPASEHWYACPLMPEPGPEDFEGWKGMVQDAKESDL